MDDTMRSSSDDQSWKDKSGARRCSDSEMLKTYSSGLLAVCLAWYVLQLHLYYIYIYISIIRNFFSYLCWCFSGGQVVEDVLTSGLSAKLMRYLRVRVLGEISTGQKDATSQAESKSFQTTASMRTREEARSRLRHASESSLLDNQSADVDHERGIGRQAHEEHWVDGEPPGIPRDNMVLDTEMEGEEKCSERDLYDGRTKSGGRSLRDEDIDESGRDDLSCHRGNRGCGRSRGKGRINEGVTESEENMGSPGSGIRLGGQGRNRSLLRNPELKKVSDGKRSIPRNSADGCPCERDEKDECFQGCIIGSKDITDIVRKAVSAAEAEARAVNAPAEAIKTAGDAAAELVKTAALEVGLFSYSFRFKF